MRRARLVGLALASSVALGGGAVRASGAQGRQVGAAMVTVGPGLYRPLYPVSPKEEEVPVAAFRLDVRPVTNGEYLAFVRANPRWRKGRPDCLFADGEYLRAWAGPLTLGPDVDARQPVVSVSWFAARAYCAARDARLPREAEWEFAAAASETEVDGRKDPEFRETLLRWYSTPKAGATPRVMQSRPNKWGVYDLHGLAWEWVLDFNSTLVSADDREAGNEDKMQFCGAGALSATDKSNYPAFMRIALRSSLHADYTTRNLTFRCAADAPRGTR